MKTILCFAAAVITLLSATVIIFACSGTFLAYVGCGLLLVSACLLGQTAEFAEEEVNHE